MVRGEEGEVVVVVVCVVVVVVVVVVAGCGGWVVGGEWRFADTHGDVLTVPTGTPCRGRCRGTGAAR